MRKWLRCRLCPILGSARLCERVRFHAIGVVVVGERCEMVLLGWALMDAECAGLDLRVEPVVRASRTLSVQ